MATPGADRLALAHQREIATIAGGVTSVVVSVAMGADLASISTWYWGVIDGLLTRIQIGYAQSRNSAMSFLPRHAALAGAPRPLELVPGSLDTAALRKRLEIVGPIGFKRAIAAGRSEEDALRAMATNMAGVADEAVRNGDRDVVEMTARHGRGIVGWRRRIGARACGFCAMLASRGAVYSSKAVATYSQRGERYHPHCHCWAEPVYRGEPDPPEVWQLRHQWERVTAGHGGQDAIRVWRRHWETVASPRARARAGVVDMRQVVLRGAPTQAELGKLSLARLRAMVADYDITVPADLSKSQLVKLAWDLERGLAPQHARALAVQAVLDQRKVVADVLAEAAEMVGKESSAKALQWLARSIRKGRPGVNPDAPEFRVLLKQMQPLLDALDAADPAAIRAAIPKVAKAAKLRQLGEAGEVVPYRREEMQFIGQSRGEYASVIRPGFATQYDGELRILLRADVMPATAEQAAAARIASLPQLRFAASRAKTYRSTGAPKRAELRDGPATIRAEWGEEQHFAGRWYAVLDDQGRVRYGAAEREWLDQNEPIPGREGWWRKVTSVEAYQHRGAPRRVETVLADGTRETVNVARDGDWIVRQVNGEVMVIPDREFKRLYEAPPAKKAPAKAAPKKAAPTPSELAEASRLAMTKEEARAALAKARTVADLREAARLRRVHVSPRATRQEIIDELVRQDVGARLQYAAMTRTPMRPGPVVEPLPLPEPRPPKKAAKAPVRKAPAKKAATREPRPAIEPSREAIELERWLSDVVGSRDEARQVVSRLSAAQLREVAAAGRIPLRARATRAEMIDKIVRWTAGRRLQAEGIAGRHLYRPGGATRAASAPTELPAWARDPRAKSSVAPTPTPSAVPKMGPRASRLPRIAEPQDMRGTALAANPKYGGAYEGPVTPAMLADGGVSYAQNCSRVVVAYEMRRRGLDVTAGPGTPMGDTPAVYLRTFRQGGKYATRVVQDLSRNMSAKDIAREVESWPLGARGIVTVKGHTLNVERDPVTGKAVFIDAQAAKSKSPVMDLQAFIRRMRARGAPTDRWMAVARVDDLDLSDWGLRYVEAPDLDPAAAQVRRTPWPDDPDSERFSTLEEMAEMTPDDSYPS